MISFFRIFQITRVITLSLACCCLISNVQAQDDPRIPKNYGGLLAGIEWNTISGFTGIEYERIVFAARHITVGVKGSYGFRYRTGNMQLLNRPCCSVANINTGFVTADYFTKAHYPSGFFIHAGLGAGTKTYRTKQSPDHRHIRPAFEVGVGWLFYLGKGVGLKWTNTITFPSRDAGITITRLALGL